VVLILAGLGAFAYGIAVFIHSLGSIVSHPFPVGNQIGYFLLDIDLFLIGVTLLISAIGFYELFIRDIPGDQAILPAWLEIHDLNALKARVLAMIVLVLSVSFAEVAVDSPNSRQVLEPATQTTSASRRRLRTLRDLEVDRSLGQVMPNASRHHGSPSAAGR
jgi:uncharacterized membrane protein YqhA